MTSFDAFADLRHQDWREDAHCLTAPRGTEFVDIAADVAESLVYRYCHRCRVVGPCREQANSEAPYAWRVVMGAKVWERGEKP